MACDVETVCVSTASRGISVNKPDSERAQLFEKIGITHSVCMATGLHIDIAASARLQNAAWEAAELKNKGDVQVKSIRTCLAFLFLLALPVASFAKNSREVTFDTPVKVGDTQLDAGTYKVTWSGSGSQVEVSFSQNGNNVASATAQLTNEPGPYDSAVQVKKQDDGSEVLMELDFKNLELIFSSQNQPSGN